MKIFCYVTDFNLTYYLTESEYLPCELEDLKAKEGEKERKKERKKEMLAPVRYQICYSATDHSVALKVPRIAVVLLMIG